MKTVLALLGALSAFFMVLNSLGGIVSGIWLAVLGEWWAIGLGLVGILVSSFLIGIALLPTAAIGAATLALGQRSKAAFLILTALSNVYVVAVITVWCVGVLFLFASRAGEHTLIPLLIWSYGLATGPWSYMASRESQGGGGEASVAAAFFAQVAYLVMVLVGVFLGGTLVFLAKVFAGVMLVNVAIQMLIAYTVAEQLYSEAEQVF